MYRRPKRTPIQGDFSNTHITHDQLLSVDGMCRRFYFQGIMPVSRLGGVSSPYEGHGFEGPICLKLPNWMKQTEAYWIG